VIVQIDPTEREDVTLDVLEMYDERTYGNTTLLFFERPAPDEDEPGVVDGGKLEDGVG
jgi:hypothetical protein